MILVENVIGRRLRVNSIDAFGDKIQDKGKNISQYWKILGYMGILGAFGIMAYYMVLGGWVISYIINLISGGLDISEPITKDVAKISMNYTLKTVLGKLLVIPSFSWPLTTLFWPKVSSAGLNAR